jgi:hypothetical protein
MRARKPQSRSVILPTGLAGQYRITTDHFALRFAGELLQEDAVSST